MQTVSVISPAIVEATIKAFDKSQTVIGNAVRKATETEDKAIQQTLDAMLLACDKPKAEFLKGNSASNPARGQIKGMFEALAEAQYISKATASVYQTCFWMAFEQGVPFSRTLAKDAKPKDKADKPAVPKSGKVTNTTRAELDKTLTKALTQARALLMADFAADLLDICLERLDGFKEIE
jgi:hypothetical protein